METRLLDYGPPTHLMAATGHSRLRAGDYAAAQLIAVSGHQPEEIAYVGDRLDNDLRPAATAGLRTVFIRRGPWGYITYQPGTADLELDTLTDLPAALPTLPTD